MTDASLAGTTELLHLASSAGAYGFFRFSNVAINVWLGQPTGEAVRCLAELTAVSRKTCPQGISSVHYMAQGVALPTPEARAGLRQIVNDHGDHIACVGVVLRGDGFWAAAVRSALSGILLVGPKAPFSLRLYGSADELADWLPTVHHKRTRTSLDRATLLARIRSAAP